MLGPGQPTPSAGSPAPVAFDINDVLDSRDPLGRILGQPAAQGPQSCIKCHLPFTVRAGGGSDGEVFLEAVGGATAYPFKLTGQVILSGLNGLTDIFVGLYNGIIYTLHFPKLCVFYLAMVEPGRTVAPRPSSASDQSSGEPSRSRNWAAPYSPRVQYLQVQNGFFPLAVGA